MIVGVSSMARALIIALLALSTITDAPSSAAEEVSAVPVPDSAAITNHQHADCDHEAASDDAMASDDEDDDERGYDNLEY